MALSINAKTFKILYIIPALIVTLLAIVTAYLHYEYIAAGLIVLGSVIVLAGSYIFAQLYLAERKKDMDKF